MLTYIRQVMIREYSLNGYNNTYLDDIGKQHWKAKDNTNYSEMYKNRFNLTYHLQ